jgi:hypothetical protein
MSEVKEKKATTKAETKAATKTKKEPTNVIEVEATEEAPFDENDNADKVQEITSEIPTVDEVISKEIAKYSRVIPAIAELKKEYMGLTIKDIDDEEGYKAVSKALRLITSKGSAVESVRKQLKAPYYSVGVAIDDKAKEIVAMLAPIKTYLKDTKQVIDDARLERETQLELERQRVLKYRNDMLIQAGMSLIGNTYVWKDPFDSNVEETLMYVNIETMDDNDFNEELQKIVDLQAAADKRKQDEKDKIEKEKEENRQKEEALKAELESIRNEKIQMRLDFLTELGCSVSQYREKRAFGVVEENSVFYEHKNKGFIVCTKDSLADTKDWSGLMQETRTKISDLKKAVLEEEEKENETQKREEDITKKQNEKVEVLKLIGLSFSEMTGFFFYKNRSIISYPQLRDISDEVWQEKISEFKQKMVDIDAELKKQEEEENQKKLDEAKKQIEEEQKKLAAEEEERVSNLNDKQKLSEYVTALLAVKAPEFKTPKYKELYNKIQTALNNYK